MAKQDEDRILREWTPFLLRTILIAAMIFLVAGLVLTYTIAPDYYVARYRAVQQGHLIGKEEIGLLSDRIRQGNPHAVLTFALFLLPLLQLTRRSSCCI